MIKLLIWFELPKGDDGKKLEKQAYKRSKYKEDHDKGLLLSNQSTFQEKKLQNQLQEEAAPFAQMATGGHNADEVAANTSSSRQLERFTTGEDLQLALSPPPARSTGPAQEEKKQRHSADQIQRMETMFKECSHPDYMQRLKLSEELGLTPQQVLFWFQNRRTQLRARQNRNDNAMLLEENERLRWENNRMKADMSRISCPNCSFSTWLQKASPEQRQLYFENARLREQLSRIAAMFGIPPA